MLTKKTKSVFYQEPAFRFNAFLGNTILVLLDLALYGATLFKEWQSLKAVEIFHLTFGTLCLVLLWFIALDRQRYVLRLFKAGGLEKPAPNSSLDIALSIASDITEWGLLTASVSVGALLWAAGELSRR